MSTLFISHSSQDNAEAQYIYDWLKKNGWNDVFLDINPEKGIVAGERWERALHQAADRCDAVIFLVSPAWLSSEWCLKEFRLAQRLNKRIIALKIADNISLDAIPRELRETWQIVDLTQGNDHEIIVVRLDTGVEKNISFSAAGLMRLRAGLTKVGLDPRFFAWPPSADPDRDPYPGLMALEPEDAGIFFGREAQIIELMGKARGMREVPGDRILVFLGASGSGKSSFLRAGIWPRLARDDRNFMPLQIVRPDVAVITGDNGLLNSLENAFKNAKVRMARKSLRDALMSDTDAAVSLFQDLARIAVAPLEEGVECSGPPTLVLGVDQAEELFNPRGQEESKRFLDLLRAVLLLDSLDLMVMFTIRSDAYDNLQLAPALMGLHQSAFNLPPMPYGAFQSVIEGPAACLAGTDRELKIEPALTQCLLRDIEQGDSKDALPLLAFTLQMLFKEYGGSGTLRLSDYHLLGGVKGTIEAAVEGALEAAASDPNVPRDRDEQLSLLRRGFIPWLAGVDPITLTERRRVAKWSEIPVEARPLIKHLINQRLLSTDRDNATQEDTVEPAHEALLRQWSQLKQWLKEDAASLAMLYGAQQSTLEWDAHGRHSDWLAHSGQKLEDVKNCRARKDFASFFGDTDLAYIDACIALDDERRSVQQSVLHNLGLAFAEKANRAFCEGNVNEGQVYASHALARINPTVTPWLPPTLIGQRLLHRGIGCESLSGQPGQVVSLAFSPDGSLLARGLANRTIELWDIATRTRLSVFLGHESWVGSVAFSPDGLLLASTAADKSLRLWDVASRQLIAVLRVEPQRLTALSFSGDGRRIACGSIDGLIRVWDVAIGAIVCQWTGHEGAINGVAFSPSGTILASAAADNTVRLWDVLHGTSISHPLHHSRTVESLAYSPDGTLIATGAWDNRVRLWEANSGELLGEMIGHSKEVWSVAFSRDGRLLATGSGDTTVRLWDVSNRQPLLTLCRHKDKVSSVAFSLTGMLASGSLDKTVRMWPLEIDRLLQHRLQGRARPDNQATVCSPEQVVRLWDITNRTVLAWLCGHTGAVCSVVFSPDGTTVATAATDQTIRLWDVLSATCRKVMPGHTAGITSVVFSPDGTLIASGSEDATVRLWDATGNLLSVLLDHTETVNSVAFSPDGKWIASGSADMTVRLWDIQRECSFRVLSGHTEPVTTVAFAPSGEMLASGSRDKHIRVWNVDTGDERAVLEGHDDWVFSVVYSRDGNLLVSGSQDMTVRLWDTRTYTLQATLDRYDETIYTIMLSPDGETLALGDGEKPVLVRDESTGKARNTLEMPKNRLSSVAFSPDGRVLAASSGDRMPKLDTISTAEFSITDWQSQAVEDEVRFGLRLEGAGIVPVLPPAD
jgi:WD40 repeat protein